MPRTHLLRHDENNKSYADRRTFCGLNRYTASYGFTNLPSSGNMCDVCMDNYRKETAMRHPDNAIFTTDLDALTGVDGHQIWDALHTEYPDVTLRQRTRVINHLINEQARGKPEIWSAEAFFRNELMPESPIRIITQNVKGVVTDVKRNAGMLIFVIDGNAHIVHPMAKIELWPLGAGVETEVKPTLVNNFTTKLPKGATVRSNAGNLMRNKESWIGKEVKIEGSVYEGIFTDAHNVGSPGTITMVLDGKIYTCTATEYVLIRS